MRGFMIVTTAQLYKVAYGKFAVGAYNINNAEQTMGLFRGCIDSQAPFIIQISCKNPICESRATVLGFKQGFKIIRGDYSDPRSWARYP